MNGVLSKWYQTRLILLSIGKDFFAQITDTENFGIGRGLRDFFWLNLILQIFNLYINAFWVEKKLNPFKLRIYITVWEHSIVTKH